MSRMIPNDSARPIEVLLIDDEPALHEAFEEIAALCLDPPMRMRGETSWEDGLAVMVGGAGRHPDHARRLRVAGRRREPLPDRPRRRLAGAARARRGSQRDRRGLRA